MTNVAGQREASYGIVRRIFEHKNHLGVQLVFKIDWLKCHGRCDKTDLMKVGGLDVEWSGTKSPFEYASSLCTGNVLFWPQEPYTNTQVVTDEGSNFFAIEPRVQSH